MDFRRDEARIFSYFDVGELIKGYFLALIRGMLSYLFSETS